MAVAEIRELWPGRDAEFNLSFTPDNSANRQFLVRTTSTADNAVTIYGATASGITLPILANVHPSLTLQTVRKITCTPREESPFLWFYGAAYSDKPIKPPKDPNPLNRPASIDGDSTQFSKNTVTDADGNPELNSAGDLYDPHEIDDARWDFNVQKNVPYNAVPSWVLSANNVVNSDPFTIVQLGLTGDAKTFKVSKFKFSDIKSEEVEGLGTIQYRTLGFTLSYREEGWQFKPADRGYRAIVQEFQAVGDLQVGDRYRIKVKDKTGALVYPSAPVFLDGDGGELPEASIPSGIVTNVFDDYRVFDFSVISPYTV